MYNQNFFNKQITEISKYVKTWENKKLQFNCWQVIHYLNTVKTLCKGQRSTQSLFKGSIGSLSYQRKFYQSSR